jgi:hypothetical protein
LQSQVPNGAGIVDLFDRGVAKLLIEPLDDEELAVLERALNKVTVECTFG